MGGPKPAKATVAYNEIKRRIVTGLYNPGHRLVVDAIADDLSVSAVPVRQAIKRLESEKLVSVEKFVGATVLGLAGNSFREEIEAVAYLESVVASLSVPELTESDLDRLHEIHQMMVDEKDRSVYAHLNSEFHGVMCSRCTNHKLLRMLQELWSGTQVLLESAFVQMPELGPETNHTHLEILDVLTENPSPERMREIVFQHRLATIDVFDRVVERQARLARA
ncbi:GntR family transcriptional regulator [Arthrobacter sp. KNU40]|uniref:GntR family transcriptional regulator n=1 Tax=Arthrobacter sp. KNU40 TaxID=3447965 RepID=UPI003F6171F5